MKEKRKKARLSLRSIDHESLIECMMNVNGYMIGLPIEKDADVPAGVANGLLPKCSSMPRSVSATRKESKLGPEGLRGEF